jgi:hypothetical protein
MEKSLQTRRPAFHFKGRYTGRDVNVPSVWNAGDAVNIVLDYCDAGGVTPGWPFGNLDRLPNLLRTNVETMTRYFLRRPRHLNLCFLSY